jgi:NAD(P)-dependent dehydrogenase (short-subunit alcohol dehydrogenase family)
MRSSVRARCARSWKTRIGKRETSQSRRQKVTGDAVNFSNHIAVITGGASGIGAACARFVAEHGGRVVVADRNLPAAQALAGEIGAHAVEIDVADEALLRRTAAWIDGEIGAVTILVNSAGVLQRTVPPDELTMKEWDLIHRIDMRGTYLCCAIFGSAMAARGRGAIVNVASVAGMVSGPLHAYGPAKAAVINLTQCLAAEWGPRGVRVNAVSPGFTKTPALDRGIQNNTMTVEAMQRASAMGRLVEAKEIAAATCFLASDLASAITGVNLPVDAGYLAAAPWGAYGGLR